jgi:tRNA A37 methylthiotransferase MiaB
MPNQVPVHVARERNRILRELAAGKKQAFMQTFIGKEIEAITLSGPCGAGTLAREASATQFANQAEKASAFTEALTDNYLKLHLRGHHTPNRWQSARIEDVVDGALTGFIPEQRY